jgi:hypothetical protein
VQQYTAGDAPTQVSKQEVVGGGVPLSSTVAALLGAAGAGKRADEMVRQQGEGLLTAQTWPAGQGGQPNSGPATGEELLAAFKAREPATAAARHSKRAAAAAAAAQAAAAAAGGGAPESKVPQPKPPARKKARTAKVAAGTPAAAAAAGTGGYLRAPGTATSGAAGAPDRQPGAGRRQQQQ